MRLAWLDVNLPEPQGCEPVFNHQAEFLSSEAFSVFPNPSSGLVVFKGNEQSQDIKTLRVFNVLGEIMREQRFSGNETRFNFKQPGLFFYQISDQQKAIASGSIVIQ